MIHIGEDVAQGQTVLVKGSADPPGRDWRTHGIGIIKINVVRKVRVGLDLDRG